MQIWMISDLHLIITRFFRCKQSMADYTSFTFVTTIIKEYIIKCLKKKLFRENRTITIPQEVFFVSLATPLPQNPSLTKLFQIPLGPPLNGQLPMFITRKIFRNLEGKICNQIFFY